MRYFLIWPLIVFLLSGAACAQTRQTYAYGDDPLQQLDVYKQGAAIDQPMIVMLHGGGWRIGDKRNQGVWRAKVDHWVPQGFIFIAVNTRLLPNHGPHEQATDLAVAMRFIQQHADAWGGASDRIILMGHSSGGHIAAQVATSDELQTEAELLPWRGTIILDSGGLDLLTVMQNRPPRVFRNAFGNDPAYWQDMSPIAALSNGDGPLLIVCSASRARTCPIAQRFQRAAVDSQVDAQILRVDLPHDAINRTLGEANTYTEAVSAWIAAQLR